MIRQRGQATVEVALVLPVLVLLCLLVAQVATIATDAVLVHHAAREAARAAAVQPDADVARRAAIGAAGLRPDRLELGLAGGTTAGETLTVTVEYAAPTDVPVVGRLLGDVDLRAAVSMRVE